MLYYNICCFDVLQTAKAAFYNEKTDQGGYYVRRAKGGGGAQSMGVPYETGYEGIKEVPNVAHGTIPCPMNPKKIRQLTVEEIHQMVELYARSCARAKKSGFGGVEIYAHGGYLLSEFLSPFYNNRTDEYGGTFENRTRVLFEIIEKVQAYCGANYPIIVRFAADEGIGDKGRQLGESIELAKLLEKAGVCALDISAGPAGLEAARTAALRGHHVDLYDKANGIGEGRQFTAACTPPAKSNLENIKDYLEVSGHVPLKSRKFYLS